MHATNDHLAGELRFKQVIRQHHYNDMRLQFIKLLHALAMYTAICNYHTSILCAPGVLPIELILQLQLCSYPLPTDEIYTYAVERLCLTTPYKFTSLPKFTTFNSPLLFIIKPLYIVDYFSKLTTLVRPKYGQVREVSLYLTSPSNEPSYRLHLPLTIIIKKCSRETWLNTRGVMRCAGCVLGACEHSTLSYHSQGWHALAIHEGQVR